MRRRILFGVVTFIIGWVAQAVTLYTVGPTWSFPHWTLLIVLAMGGIGETNLAQSLGFFWGLAMDAHGLSLFGSQGWLLCLTGYLSGRFSRHLDSEKLVTQTAMSLAGTIFLQLGLIQIDVLFRWPPRSSSVDLIEGLGQVLLNLMAAPMVFWLVHRWAEMWIVMEKRSASRD